jgi:arsenical pump membrane protein
MPVSHIVLVLIISISILLMLVRPRDIPEVYWVGGGALLLLVLRQRREAIDGCPSIA